MNKLIIGLAGLFLLFSLSACGPKGENKSGKEESCIQKIESTIKNSTHPGAAKTGAKPTVIDFYATWCGPCKQIAPMFEMLKSEYSDKIEFRSVDVDQDLETTTKYGIQAMPTFVILNSEGKEIKRIVGADAEALTKAVDALVND